MNRSIQPTFTSSRPGQSGSRLTCRETGDSYSFVPNGRGFTVRRNGEKIADRSTRNGALTAIECDARWTIRSMMQDSLTIEIVSQGT